MKRQVSIIVVVIIMCSCTQIFAQNGSIQTVFKHGFRSGGYGALTNEFTTIRGKFANLSGIYGGWYINHAFMLGVGASAVTNNLKVPEQYSANPLHDMSYEYGQVGLMTEYVINSGKPVHFVFNLFTGAGFTLQYMRHSWQDNYSGDTHNENWFVVAQPGAQVEINLLKWMRFSPGIAYRKSFGSDAPGLKDKDISNITYNATLKFGRF